jgi:hypothetical protein
MEIGWMWFDNDEERTLEEKIQLAVQHYREKFGNAPNTCFVNKNLLAEDEMLCGRVRVVAACNIMPNYFWLGIADKPKKLKRAS